MCAGMSAGLGFRQGLQEAAKPVGGERRRLFPCLSTASHTNMLECFNYLLLQHILVSKVNYTKLSDMH